MDPARSPKRKGGHVREQIKQSKGDPRIKERRSINEDKSAASQSCLFGGLGASPAGACGAWGRCPQTPSLYENKEKTSLKRGTGEQVPKPQDNCEKNNLRFIIISFISLFFFSCCKRERIAGGGKPRTTEKKMPANRSILKRKRAVQAKPAQPAIAFSYWSFVFSLTATQFATWMRSAADFEMAFLKSQNLLYSFLQLAGSEEVTIKELRPSRMQPELWAHLWKANRVAFIETIKGFPYTESEASIPTELRDAFTSELTRQRDNEMTRRRVFLERLERTRHQVAGLAIPLARQDGNSEMAILTRVGGNTLEMIVLPAETFGKRLSLSWQDGLEHEVTSWLVSCLPDLTESRQTEPALQKLAADLEEMMMTGSLPHICAGCMPSHEFRCAAILLKIMSLRKCDVGHTTYELEAAVWRLFRHRLNHARVRQYIQSPAEAVTFAKPSTKATVEDAGKRDLLTFLHQRDLKSLFWVARRHQENFSRQVRLRDGYLETLVCLFEFAMTRELVCVITEYLNWPIVQHHFCFGCMFRPCQCVHNSIKDQLQASQLKRKRLQNQESQRPKKKQPKKRKLTS